MRILGTTDLHAHVLPFNYYTNQTADTVGLARTAGLIKQARAEATNSLLFDTGDVLQGSPLADYAASPQGAQLGKVHPVVAALNVLGFDAATLGNHDFNYGLPFLMSAMAGAAFPVVLANVATAEGPTPQGDTTLMPPYVILDRVVTDGTGLAHTLRVGAIGFTPPQIMTWDRHHLEGRVFARDIVETARAYVPQMVEEGADIILALSHSGIGQPDEARGMENAAVPLAAVDGIDVLLVGHSHLLFPSPDYDGIPAVDARAGTIHGKPATMGGCWGTHVGVVDLLLENKGGTWRVRAHEASTRAISKRHPTGRVVPLTETEPNVAAATENAHQATLAYMRRAVGKTAKPLHTYFALVANDPSLRVVQAAQSWYLKELVRGSQFEGLPILSAAAPFKAGGRGGPDFYTEVPAGEVSMRSLADLYIFPNAFRAVRVNGTDLRDWLELSARIFNKIEPGAVDQVLIDAEFPTYDFDVIDGVTYEIDPSQCRKFDEAGNLAAPPSSRIRKLRFRGAPVTDEMEFLVATNSYRMGGGGGFFAASRRATIVEAPDNNRDVVMKFVSACEEVRPACDPIWRFSPLPGTSVLFETGPAASRYLAELIGLEIEPAGNGCNGFARYRLHL